MWQQIGSGGIVDAQELSDLEGYIDEGQKGKIEFNLRWDVSADIANRLQQELNNRGVSEANVTTGDKSLMVTYRKGFPWLAVIVSAILALIVLAILIIGWRLFKDVAAVAGPGTATALLWVVIGLAVIFGVRELKKVL
jgi:hypothetical protein